MRRLSAGQKFLAAVYVGFVGVLLGLLSSGLYELVVKEGKWTATGVTIASLLLLIGAAALWHWMLNPVLNWAQARLYQRHRMQIMLNDPRELKEGRENLVVLTSFSVNPPIQSTVQWHYEKNKAQGKRLKRVWVIVGPGDGDNYPKYWFKRLKQEYDAKGDGPDWISVEVEDTEKPQLVYEAVNKVYDDAVKDKIPIASMIADMTGGTKNMTAGLVLACLTTDRDIQYLKPVKQDPESGRADPAGGSVPWIIDTSFVSLT